MKTRRYSRLSPCVRAVVDAVAHAYGLHPANIPRDDKQTRAAYARAVAIFVCRADLGMGWREIQQEFGVSSPGVMSAFERTSKRVLEGDPLVLHGVAAGETAAQPFNGVSEAAE